jgi:hypothetical protein
MVKILGVTTVLASADPASAPVAPLSSALTPALTAPLPPAAAPPSTTSSFYLAAQAPPRSSAVTRGRALPGWPWLHHELYCRRP